LTTRQRAVGTAEGGILVDQVRRSPLAPGRPPRLFDGCAAARSYRTSGARSTPFLRQWRNWGWQLMRCYQLPIGEQLFLVERRPPEHVQPARFVSASALTAGGAALAGSPPGQVATDRVTVPAPGGARAAHGVAARWWWRFPPVPR